MPFYPDPTFFLSLSDFSNHPVPDPKILPYLNFVEEIFSSTFATTDKNRELMHSINVITISEQNSEKYQ
jgi:hypothetical protein